MAPLLRRLLLLLAVVLALASSSAARPGLHFHPCNTVLVTYTLTSSDLPLQIPSDPEFPFSRHRSFAILRVLRLHSDPDAASLYFSRPITRQRPAIPSLGVTNSLRERAKDVLVVVVGLLFGVGCGALTAATMYLAWSLFTNRYEICGSDAYGYDDEEDEIESPKKIGYASIPPAPATPASPVKEGYEGN